MITVFVLIRSVMIDTADSLTVTKVVVTPILGYTICDVVSVVVLIWALKRINKQVLLVKGKI